MYLALGHGGYDRDVRTNIIDGLQFMIGGLCYH
jgi:hypothetical protein